MKRVILFLAVSIVVATVSRAQTNRVLVEEFSSSTCPPCAQTDPQIEKFETDKMAEICILKWHQNYPTPSNDPYYSPAMFARANYYGVTGIPSLFMNGNDNLFAKYDWTCGPLSDSADRYCAAMQNYYQMSVKHSHSIVGDSVIVWVTVTTGATVPSATDLNLGVVVAERFDQYRGANGRPYHTNVVRTTIPTLKSNGAINNPFNQAANTTQTYRYATVISASWNLSQLMAVAFIQSAKTAGATPKPIYQAAWDVPAITIIGDGLVQGPLPVIAGNTSSTANYTLTNNTASPQTVYVSTRLQTPANYTVEVGTGSIGADSSFIIPANSDATISVDVAASGSAITATEYAVYFRSADTIGIGGGAETAFGQDIKHAIVDQGTESELSSTEVSQLQTSIVNAGYTATGYINYSSFYQLYTSYLDWSQFKTVIFDGGYSVGFTYTIDTAMVTNFLQNGGHFISTALQLPAYCIQNPGLDTWMQNTFHMESHTFSNQVGYNNVTGVAGDPIGGAVPGTITVALNAGTQTVYPIDDSAHSVFVDASRDTVAIRATSEGGKVFYASFELGTVIASKRDAMVKSIMDWMNATAGVSDGAPTSPSCLLDANYPNPVAASTSIGYTLPDRRYVTLIVRDMLGREIATLVSNNQDAGHYAVPFDASHLANGTYIYTLTAGANKLEGKMIVNR